MASEKTCFLMSPIGDAESATRAEADALLWIVRQALAKYRFNVIRVDEIARSTVISAEIVQLIQESELCISVLTGHNPNVFYETGRRHETGKPFIQLIKRGEQIPFDLAGIRTVIYDDVESRSGVQQLVSDVSRFVEDFEVSGGYGSRGGGVTLSSIASTLDRIERRLSSVGNVGSMTQPTQFQPGGPATAGNPFANPREQFQLAMVSGDLIAASTLLPRIRQLLGDTEEVLLGAVLLTQAGYSVAADLLQQVLESDAAALEDEELRMRVVGSVVHNYGMRDREHEALERLGPILHRIAEDVKLTPETQCFYLNQLQKLYYGVGKFETALELSEKVVEIAPAEPSYWFNLSLVYEKLGLEKKCLESVTKLLSLDSSDDDHLHQAVRVFSRNGRRKEARAAYEKLKVVSPAKATMALMEREVKETVAP
jgi:tetratricopeptide (TPR) repeat protein